MNGTGLAIMMGLLLFCAIPIINTLAQDAPAADAAATDAPPAPAETSQTFLELIMAGGPFMVPLGILSIAVVSLAIRNFMIFNRNKLLRPDLLPQIEQMLAIGDIHGCQDLCRANPCILTAVVDGGIERVVTEEIDIESVKEGVEQAGRTQMTKFIKAINYLSNIGAVAPMLGLLGTVSGMIKAFQALSMGGSGESEAMAANISEALMTTATGLVIAIPASLFYFYFKNNFAETLSILGQYMGKLLNALRTGEVSGNIGHVEVTEM
jgi:biopolymer transport protein ExbB